MMGSRCRKTRIDRGPRGECSHPLVTLEMTPEHMRNEADVTTAVAPSSAHLSAADRCDRCGAQAYLKVELQSGGELLFCAHHAREHGDKIRAIAANVQDETHKLQSTPSTPPGDEF